MDRLIFVNYLLGFFANDEKVGGWEKRSRLIRLNDDTFTQYFLGNRSIQFNSLHNCDKLQIYAARRERVGAAEIFGGKEWGRGMEWGSCVVEW